MGKFDDMMLEIPRGAFPDRKSVNKFGQAHEGLQQTLTDVWDLADSVPTQQVWVAPTTSRIHAISSASSIDASGSGGARQIQIYGLVDWDTPEVSEVITLSGSSPVNTTNPYVIIHRMKVISSGSTAINSGSIIARAAVDNTITACIRSLEGQTQMAIYGIPSVQTAYITNYYASALRQVVAAYADMDLEVNIDPANQKLRYVTKHTNGLTTVGTSYFQHQFKPYYKVEGPAIIKIQGVASVADLNVSAGFDLILVNYK